MTFSSKALPHSFTPPPASQIPPDAPESTAAVPPPKKSGAPLTESVVLKIIHDMAETGIGPAIKATEFTVGQFFDFIASRSDLMGKYLESQQRRAEVSADECVYIADNEPNMDRAKVKILARQWFGSKILYRKFGDKLAVEHTQRVDIKGALDEARARAAAVLGEKPGIEYLKGPSPGESMEAWAEHTMLKHLPIEALPPVENAEWELEKARVREPQERGVDKVTEEVDIFS